MAGATRDETTDSEQGQRDPVKWERRRRQPFLTPRRIDIAWASIAEADVRLGELVFNIVDNTFVYRNKDNEIKRFDAAATRTI